MQIDKIIEALEKAKADYFSGDTVGALRHLERAERLISQEKSKICTELGREGYDAVFIK
jgi:hypothetical protein